MSDVQNKNIHAYDFWYESGQGTAFGQGTQSGYDMNCECGTFYDPEYGQASGPAHFGSMHIEQFSFQIQIKQNKKEQL